jgi:hypothetical protein
VSNLVNFTRGTRIYFYVRAVQAEQRSKDHIESSSTGRSFPIRLQDIPILGVRIGPGGQRLVYRAQRPRDEVCEQNLLQKSC